MKKKGNMIYVGFFFVLCLIPSVGMLLPQTQGSATENRKLALWPQLRTEEGWNTDFLSEAGEYFQDHFGFRQQLVTANALINGKIFGVSTADGVIQGKNGWLYYKDSLSDYLGTADERTGTFQCSTYAQYDAGLYRKKRSEIPFYDRSE